MDLALLVNAQLEVSCHLAGASFVGSLLFDA